MDVKTLCLAVLSRKTASGYEIRKEFEEGTFARIQEAGFGSIYPALKKLTEEGLARVTQQVQDSRPDKKVYRITPLGRQALFEAVNREPAPDRLRSDFLFVLIFAELLPARQLDQMIGARIAQYDAAIAAAEQAGTAGLRPGDAFVRRFGVALSRAARDFLEEHRHELVAAQLQGESPE